MTDTTGPIPPEKATGATLEARLARVEREVETLRGRVNQNRPSHASGHGHDHAEGQRALTGEEDWKASLGGMLARADAWVRCGFLRYPVLSAIILVVLAVILFELVEG